MKFPRHPREYLGGGSEDDFHAVSTAQKEATRKKAKCVQYLELNTIRGTKIIGLRLCAKNRSARERSEAIKCFITVL